MNREIKIYGVFDDDGYPTGFYSDYIHKDIPKDAVCITSDQHRELYNSDGTKAFINGEIVKVGKKQITITWDSIRLERNALISNCDWTQLPDSPLTDAQKNDWAIYRQSLRDITDKYLEPSLVIWPSYPL